MLPAESASCPNCATAAFLGERPLSGLPQISGYELIGRLGEGGMGTIYLAEEKSLARRVAIKVVAGKLATDAQARARFLREARSLATVEHANVVRIYAFGEVDGQPYLAMQYVEGETLAERIRREGRLGIDESLRMMRDILIALEAAWDKGIVHRDVKPSNVLLDKRGHVHVADFGLAKATQMPDDAALTHTGHVLGTPYYVAPEQAQGKPADFRADIYSSGILLFEMLAGERPFEGTTPFAIVAKHIGESMPSIHAKRADVPNRVARLIERMTAKSPDARPASYADLLADFDALLGITPPRSMPSTSFSTVRMPRQISRVGLIAILITLLLAAGIWFFSSRRPGAAAAASSAAPEKRMVVAVAPFYGPDDDSVKEGRVMAALIERSITARLGAGNVRVAGIDETKEPLRSHDAARALGQRLGAAVVVWGEAFALRKETEIQPYFTLIRKAPTPDRSTTAAKKTMRDVDLKSADPVAQLGEQSSGIVRMEAETPNQIELRKTSAEGVGEMVSFLAALHALYDERDARKALQFFDQAPRTAESLRHRVEAYMRLDDRVNATKTLEEVLQLDPKQVQSRAQLADQYLLAGRMPDALAAYRAAAASGQPYTTTQAIMYGDQLFKRELYKYPWAETKEFIDDATLLAIDPRTGRVTARYRLPGLLQSFQSAPTGIVIVYAADKAATQMERIALVNGRFDRPLIPGGNLSLRMQSMKAGWVVPANFMNEFTGILEKQPAHPQFRRSGAINRDLPQTLPALEQALRRAHEQDPTQPWHLFALGQTLRAQGRTGEAASAWNEMLATDYPGMLYSNYMWMAKYFERLEQYEWADRAYEKGRRDRLRLQQPVLYSTLIERLINVPIMRLHATQLHNPERAHQWLVRAREMSGVTEADNYAAAAWAGYFRRHGDLKRAAEEERFAQTSAAHPFNFLSWSTRLDYALYGYVATLFGFLFTTLMLLSRGVHPVAHRPWVLRSVFGTISGRNLPTPWGAVVVALELAGIGLFVAGALLHAEWAKVVAATVVLAAIVGLFGRGHPLKTIRSLSRRERAAIIASFACFLVAAAVLITLHNRFAALNAMPIGAADSLGHPVLVADLEARLAKYRTAPLIYSTAIANELSGNLARADELYGELPNDSRARAARGKLHEGRAVVMPSADELYDAYTAEVWRPRTSEADIGKLINLINLATTAFAALLLLLFATIRPQAVIDAPARSGSRVVRAGRKTLHLLWPGAYDLRHGSTIRGAAMSILTGFAAWLAMACWKAIPVLQSPGIITAIGLPNIKTALAFPPEDSKIDMLFAPIYARQFWAIAAIAMVVLIVLHLSRVRAILRHFDRLSPRA